MAKSVYCKYILLLSPLHINTLTKAEIGILS
jgi:hypothetical protein